jgi:hypothetical protein
MRPQSAKAKGRKFQQWVRDTILKWFDDLTERDVQSTSMGAGGEDVKLSQAAFNYLPFAIECKSRAAYAVYKDYEQAAAHAQKTAGEPILFIKANGKAPLAIVDADYFIELVWRLNQFRKDDNGS